MNTTRLLRGLYVTLLIALAAILMLPQIVLALLFVSFLIFGPWFETPACWAILSVCSGYEKAAFFVLLYAASGWIADPIVDFPWRRDGAKYCRSKRLGLSVMLAVLIAAGVYAYLSFGGRGTAAILNFATSEGIAVLGFASVVLSVAAGLVFGAVGFLGELILLIARHLRHRLQRQNV
jgi:hypothetical protein